MRTATIPTAAPSVTWWQSIRGLVRGAITSRALTHQTDGGRRPFKALPSRTATVGDKHRFSELYHHRRLALVRLALLLVDDLPTAEDVVQDAFTALLRRHGSRLANIEDPEAYLRTSVVNGARSVLRRRRTVRAHIPERERQLPSADHSVLLAETHQEVIDAVQRLTRRQREVLVLRYWSDLTEAQIADTLGVSRGTVKSTASRALDALGRQLEEIPR
ncbi:SigE family RNA polymerase sigma factor [Streptomyces parvulus]|uniref:SigE family RNA polymerase sigma factor n=1 Tax=Streptomyces parvulus TaxID=146923 RepID=A0A369UWT6_9ACTN|nr:SigE family RNA polymerase sigma factor [Streptomyces parvulus]